MKNIKTKIFCDIAELKQIRKFNKKKIVKGFTTNPSLMKSAGAKNYKDYSKKILRICPNKPVSLEVFADDYENIKDQLSVNEFIIQRYWATRLQASIENKKINILNSGIGYYSVGFACDQNVEIQDLNDFFLGQEYHF